MGIFDGMNMDDPQTQALLAAAAQMMQQSGPSLTPHSFGQVAGGGLQAYTGAMAAAQKQKKDDELRALQMTQARMGNERGGLELQQMREQLARQGKIRDQLGALHVGEQGQPAAMPPGGDGPMPSIMNGNPGQDAAAPDWMKPQQPAQGGMSGLPSIGTAPGGTPASPFGGFGMSAPPKPAQPAAPAAKPVNATENYVNRLMQEAAVYSQNGDFDGADKRLAAAAKLMPEVNKMETLLQNGKPVTVITFKNGKQEVSEFAPLPKVHWADNGQKIQPIDENTNQPIGTGIQRQQTPDSIASNASAAAGRKQAAEFHDAGKIPVGYRMSEDGTRLEAIPGGPADLGKALPNPAVKDLGSAGAAVENTRRLASSFKKDYGGKSILGDMSNTIGRLAGDDTGQAQWWQDMDALQNQTRHELFGSALTSTELAAWEKTSITPRMEAKQIQDNLQRRQEIEARAASKLARSYVAAGYNKNQIAELLGTAAQYVENPAQPVAPAGPRAKSTAPSAGPRRSVMPGQVLDGYRFKGGDPSDQNNWEKQ